MQFEQQPLDEPAELLRSTAMVDPQCRGGIDTKTPPDACKIISQRQDHHGGSRQGKN
jgi:hypothetical protein